MVIRSILRSPVTSNIVHHVPNSTEVQGVVIPVMVKPHGYLPLDLLLIPIGYKMYMEGVQ